MIDRQKAAERARQKEKVRQSFHTAVDPENYQYFPEKERQDYFDDCQERRVAVYVRVSTGDVKQTSSFELQKQHYEEFVVHHPHWTLVGIYADEGISGTSLKHRDEFNRMIADAKKGGIDMIVCKSISRFSRNIIDCLSTLRNLERLHPPVGVFFEAEQIFSLRQDSSLPLSLLATFAEEESHTRSRSMEISLRMRLDKGKKPLTPKLLGYTHDGEGHLVVDPEEAPTVRLAFFMYLYGYSTQQIAEAFTTMGRRSYLGNVDKWTPNSIVQLLRNERYCGDVLTRKTFTPDFRDHLSKKNRGERPQSWYGNHHEAIVSRDDYIAVQQLLNNAKYKNGAFLPTIQVIDRGLLKGFVTVHPKWAGFGPEDYLRAAQSVCPEAGADNQRELVGEYCVEARAGDFDLRGFEIARAELIHQREPVFASFGERKISFSAACVRRFGRKNYVELLIDPIHLRFAVRPAEHSNRAGVFLSKLSDGVYVPRDISASAFGPSLLALFGWRSDRRYRASGSFYEQGEEIACVFDCKEALALLKPHALPQEDGEEIMPLLRTGKRIAALPSGWTSSFGQDYYFHERTLPELAAQSESEWQLQLSGRLFEVGERLKITGFQELKAYIEAELCGFALTEEEKDD